MKDVTPESVQADFDDPLKRYEPASYETPLQEVLAEETVTAIDAKPFPQIEPSATVRDAVKELHDLKVASLLVTEGNKLKGIFTERDVLENVAERFGAVADEPVRTVMTSEPVVVYECDPIAGALAAIAVGGYRHVPVLNLNEEVVGIVSPRRLFDFLDRRFPSPVR